MNVLQLIIQHHHDQLLLMFDMHVLKKYKYQYQLYMYHQQLHIQYHQLLFMVHLHVLKKYKYQYQLNIYYQQQLLIQHFFDGIPMIKLPSIAKETKNYVHLVCFRVFFFFLYIYIYIYIFICSFIYYI